VTDGCIPGMGPRKLAPVALPCLPEAKVHFTNGGKTGEAIP
jgi:hypothetical protein